MSYRVLYDIATDPPFDTQAGMLALGFIYLGAIWQIAQRAKDHNRLEPPSRKGLTTSKMLIGFSAVIAVLGIGLMGWDHWRLVQAVDNGRIQGRHAYSCDLPPCRWNG